MSDAPEQQVQADEAQAQAGGIDANAELLNKISLLEANNQKPLKEKKNASASVEDLQRQIADLQNNQQKAKQTQLAEAGEFKRCGRRNRHGFNPSGRNRATEAAASGKGCGFPTAADQSIRTQCPSQSGVVNPDQAFSLLKENLRLKDGVQLLSPGASRCHCNSI